MTLTLHRQASRSLAAGDELGERQCLPAVAARTVGVEPVVVLVQSGKSAEINHPPSVAPQRARVVSLDK